MAWAYYFDPVPAIEKGIKHCIENMHRNVYFEFQHEPSLVRVPASEGAIRECNADPDVDLFDENVYLGVNTIFLICIYVETSLNSILIQHVKPGISANAIRKLSIEKKIYEIMGPEKISSLLNSHDYSLFNDMKRIRNKLVHYKYEVNESFASMPPLTAFVITTGKESESTEISLPDLCSPQLLARAFESTKNMIKQVAASMDLVPNPITSSVRTDATGVSPTSFVTQRDIEIAREMDFI